MGFIPSYQQLGDLWQLLQERQLSVASVLFAVVFYFVCVWTLHLLFGRGKPQMDLTPKRINMSQTRKDKFQHALGDFLFDQWCKDELTKEEYFYFCRTMGEWYGFTALRRVIVKLHPKRIKAHLRGVKNEIKRRREANGKAPAEKSIGEKLSSLSK